MSESPPVNEKSSEADKIISHATRELFILEEYKLIKQENLVSIQAHQATLTFSIPALLATIGFWTQLWDKEFLFCVAGFVFLPLFSTCMLRVWLGEINRMARASYFLWMFERAISCDQTVNSHEAVKTLTVDHPLQWETWVRGKNRFQRSMLMAKNYFSVINLFLFVAGSTVILSTIRVLYAAIWSDDLLSGMNDSQKLKNWGTSMAIVGSITYTAGVLWHLIRLRKACIKVIHTYRK